MRCNEIRMRLKSQNPFVRWLVQPARANVKPYIQFQKMRRRKHDMYGYLADMIDVLGDRKVGFEHLRICQKDEF